MKMCNQEIYDFIVSHLRSMNQQCTKGACCTYLNSETGMRCAVGALFPILMKSKKIPRSIMNQMENFEGGVYSFIIAFQLYLPKWFKEARPLLLDLQKVHDRWTLVGPVDERQLKEVAEDFNLIYKEKI